MAPLKIVYWGGIKARSYALIAVCQGTGLEHELVTTMPNGEPLPWPPLAGTDIAPKLPFGVVPIIEHGDVICGETLACIRYAGRLAGTNGETDAEYAMSEMLIESYSNIYNMFNKAHYAADKAAAWAEVFEGENGQFNKLAACLEKMIPDGSTFFVPEKRVTGGYCIAAALNMGTVLEPTCLDNFPKLKAFHDEMIASPAFDGIRDYGMYFTRA